MNTQHKLDFKPIVKKLRKMQGTSEPDPLYASPRNIGRFRTSKLTYIVDDLLDLQDMDQVSPSAIAKILMARGVARSFLIRRKVLNYAKNLSSRMTIDYGMLAKGSIKRPAVKVPVEVRNYYKLLGRLEALSQISKEINEIGNYKGFAVPDNDSNFVNLLRVSGSELRKV